MNRDNDDTFESLLSNQRKLLEQIQQETNSSAPSSPQQQQQQQQPPFTIRPNPNNFMTSTIAGVTNQNLPMYAAPSIPIQYQVGNIESAFHLMNAQRANLPLHYQQQHNQNVNRLYPSAPPAALQSQTMPPPLPSPPMATNRPQPSSTTTTATASLDWTTTNDLIQDYILEPTPLRYRRLSLTLGLSSPDALNDFLEESSVTRRASASSGGAFEKLTNSNQKTHHHDTKNNHDLSRIQVSQGLFDFDSDSPGDSSFSHLFEDQKPRHSSPKDKDTTQQKEGRRRQDKRRETTKRRKTKPKAKQGSPEMREKGKKKKEDNTTTYQSNTKNRKISSEVQKLADALEKSAQSQQDIHKWDRKMGLKRSHSKTMTQSMQSRKRLRGILHNIADTIKKPS